MNFLYGFIVGVSFHFSIGYWTLKMIRDSANRSCAAAMKANKFVMGEFAELDAQRAEMTKEAFRLMAATVKVGSVDKAHPTRTNLN